VKTNKRAGCQQTRDRRTQKNRIWVMRLCWSARTHRRKKKTVGAKKRRGSGNRPQNQNGDWNKKSRWRTAHVDGRPAEKIDVENLERTTQANSVLSPNKTRCKLKFFIEIQTKITSDLWSSPYSLPHLVGN
jgi:hypothetical protein